MRVEQNQTSPPQPAKLPPTVRDSQSIALVPETEIPAQRRFRLPLPSPEWRNFIAMGVLVLGLSVWFWRHTKWFDTITQWLGMGGALAWVAVFTRVIPADKVASLQAWFYDRIFKRRASLIVMAIIAGLLALASLFFSSVQIRSLLGEDASVFTGVSADRGAFDRLEGGETFRRTVRVSPLGSDYVVRVGDDERTIRVYPWRGARLRAPYDFWTRSLLIKPNAVLISKVRDKTAAVQIDVNGETFTIDKWAGQAIWVGGAGKLPDATVNQLTSQAPPDSDTLWFWTHPVFPSGPASIEMDAGKSHKIKIRYKPPGQEFTRYQEFELKPRKVAKSSDELIQTEVLDVLQ
jgi:hypothetical protein